MKILIADPHPDVQSALRLMLSRIPEITLMGDASSLVQLLAQCAKDCPDLILFDLELLQPTRAQRLTMAELTIILRGVCPRSQVVVMSSRFEAEEEALLAGASGFISKTELPDVVLSRIKRFLDNRS